LEWGSFEKIPLKWEKILLNPMGNPDGGGGRMGRERSLGFIEKPSWG
jgi:hypothetical protein